MPYKDKTKQNEYWRAYYLKNKDKVDAYKKKWQEENPEKMAQYAAAQNARYKAHPEKFRRYYRNNRIKKVYGLSEQQYAELVIKQDNKCGICGNEPSGLWHGDRRLNVDHCHDSGKIRGLLCNQCNRGLGLMGDSVELIERAAAYLTRFEGSKS